MNDELFALWQPLRKYMACMSQTVDLWRGFLLTQTIDWLPQKEIGEWLERIKTTLNVLEELHIYDELSSLSISSQSSGFPDSKHINQAKLMLDMMEKGGSINSLKKAFLDTLFYEQSINIHLLEKVAKAKAENLLNKSDILMPFQLTMLHEIKSSTGQRAFVCSWERYVMQPFPVKYVMLFDVSDKWSPSEEEINRLKHVLMEETSLIFSLKDFARTVDRSNADIHPKWIGRIILGPVFISNVTQDDHQLQHVLNDIAAPDEFLGASRIIYEYLVSEGEESVKTLIDPRGIRHTKIQKYASRCDGEHSERGVTHLEKHLFAPHDVIQRLDSEYRKEIGHQLNSY